MEKFRILTAKEEKDVEDLATYYEELRKYLAKCEYKNHNENFMKVREKMNILIKKLLGKIFKYDVNIEGLENIPEGAVIYASSHQDFNDILNSIYANPNHALTLNASTVKDIIKKLLFFNGAIFVDRDSKESRNDAKIEMQKSLAKGRSINMYPEATWNCTPSKLHLPFYIGMMDMAKRMGVPVIPVVQEYIYDESVMDGKSHIKSVTIKFCEPVYVSVCDNIYEKLEEFDEIFSTARWDLIERKGEFSRSDITNKNYTDYIKARIHDWRIPGNDIVEERKQVFGSEDEKYVFTHVNDVPFDENDNFLPTEHVRKLIALNKKHLRR